MPSDPSSTPLLLAVILAIPLIISGVYWSYALLRIRRVLREHPTVRHGLSCPLPAELPLISIIVPAHNEERVIRTCVRSLLDQRDARIEVIVVLDRCTDRTRERLLEEAAGDPRLRVIENTQCAPEWAGKCNAARGGAEAANGEWLLFTDADVRFDPLLVRASLALAIKRDLGLLSLLSTLTTHRSFERIVQPMAAFHLLRLFPIDRANRAVGGRPFANGQFMLFSRKVYEAIGGHHRVREDLLEDIAFARAVHADGHRLGVALAEEMLTVSMYDSYRDFRRGWARIFIEACRRRPGRLATLGMRTALAGTLMPLLQLTALLVGIEAAASDDPAIGTVLIVIASLSALVHTSALGLIYRQSRTPLAGLAAHPLGSLAVAGIMLRASIDLCRRTPVRWGGREYVLTPR